MHSLTGTAPAHFRSLAEALAPAREAAAALPPGPSERELAFEAARREGMARGLAEAEAEIARRVGEAVERLEAQASAAQARLDAAVEAAGRRALGIEAAVAAHARLAEETAVEAAYAALIRFLDLKAVDGDLMIAVCRQALSSLGTGATTLRVACGGGIDGLPANWGVAVVEDPALAPGQCIVESVRGASDTGLDVRLEAMRRAFLDGLAEHRKRE